MSLEFLKPFRAESKSLISNEKLAFVSSLTSPCADPDNIRYSKPCLVDQTHTIACPTCGDSFGIFSHKTNCMCCGQVVCKKCCNNAWYIPKFGYSSKVKVCKICDRQLDISIRSEQQLKDTDKRILLQYLQLYNLYSKPIHTEKQDLIKTILQHPVIPNRYEVYYRTKNILKLDLEQFSHIHPPNSALNFFSLSSDGSSNSQNASSSNYSADSQPDKSAFSSTWFADKVTALSSQLGDITSNISDNLYKGLQDINSKFDGYQTVDTASTPASSGHFHDNSRSRPTYTTRPYSSFDHSSAFTSTSNPTFSSNRSDLNSNTRSQNSSFNNTSTHSNFQNQSSQHPLNPCSDQSHKSSKPTLSSSIQSIPSVQDLILNNTEIGSLSAKSLKAILVKNHVNIANVLEKKELVAKLDNLIQVTNRENAILKKLEAEEIEEQLANSSNVSNTSNKETCRICFDAVINCVLLNCGHMCCCTDCADMLINSGNPECPFCREHIAKAVHVFRV
ncbi:hypothetical protein BB561_003361 [Smittium simulii]|uniref:RING-type domain-containing protein n=1 Tax=Smittium simulii TaxID=133385 RepID=A0A2T9YLX3_9FUNG|nr:hypothetical protein BB561_003361 [Smittium simulii]